VIPAYAWLVLLGVVDVIDGDVARVEWEGTHFAYLHTSALPRRAEEGEVVRLRLHRKPNATLKDIELPFLALPPCVRGATITRHTTPPITPRREHDNETTAGSLGPYPRNAP
jgi:hypothetical protein